MIELRDALLANRDAVAVALEAAVAELETCMARCAELEGWIDRARAVLGLEEPEKDPLTLHDAMQVVLREHGDGLTAPALAKELNRRRLYRQKNGKPVEPGQVHARAGAYQGMFGRQQGRIVLRNQAVAR